MYKAWCFLFGYNLCSNPAVTDYRQLCTLRKPSCSWRRCQCCRSLCTFFLACEYYGSLVQLFYEMWTLRPDVKVLLIFGISWGLASREEPSQTAHVVGARSNNSVDGSQRSVEAARDVNVWMLVVTWLLSRVLSSSEARSHEGFIRLSHDCKPCRHLVNRRSSTDNLTIFFIHISHRWGYTDILRSRGEMKKLMIKTSDGNRRGEAEVINARRKKIHTKRTVWDPLCTWALYLCQNVN